jgi:ribosomal protein S18 acetylase RimI-like enzyme
VPVIVRAQRSDVARLRIQLADAFRDDPVASWLFPEAQTRKRDLEIFFATQLRHGYLPRGIVMKSDDDLASAMWMPSWTEPLGTYDRLCHLRIPILMRSEFRLARSLTRMLADAHPREPHLYLGTIGTDLSVRGRGYASALLDELDRHANKQFVGAYLECSQEENVGFYERRGFSVLSEVKAPFGGPRLWLMWRHPNTELS